MDFTIQQCLGTVAVHFGKIEPTPNDLEQNSINYDHLLRLVHVMKQYHMAIDYIADKYRDKKAGKVANEYLDWLGIPE